MTDGDFKVIEDLVKKIVKEKQPFERLEMTKEDLLEMFKYNEFKVRLLNEKVKTPTTTVYRCGPLIGKGPFNIYVNKQGWVGGQSNVYYHKVYNFFLFTVFVY